MSSESVDEITAIFGANVRVARRKLGYSQEELALRAGLHRTYISAVERGRRNISLVAAARLAKVLGVTVSDLTRPEDSSGQ